MKQLFKPLSILLLVIISALWTSASAVEIDGIYYYLNGNTATVTNKNQKNASNYDEANINAYSGTVTIPSTISYQGKTYTVTSIQKYAFYDCTDLKTINIPSTVSSINLSDNDFYGCVSLKAFIVSSDNPYYSSAGGVLFNKAKTIIYRYPQAKSGAYTVPSTVKTIGEYAFYGCESLTSASLPNSITSICDAAFYGCKALTSINIPTSLTELGSGVFYGDYSLSSEIMIPSGVRRISEFAFYNCSALTSIKISEGIEDIGDYSFDGCKKINEITLPTTLKKLGHHVFSNCNSLSSINIPTGIEEISDYAFYYCNLTSITLPESVKKIGKAAFYYNCIPTIKIPKSVTSIDIFALYQSSICDVYAYNSPSLITLSSNNPFYKCPGLKIHVYTPLVEAFKTTGNWKEYAAHIVGDIPINPITNITFDKKSITMDTYTEGKLIATVKPDDASIKDVIYTSSNEDVVIFLDNTGKFMTMNEGTAIITATATDGSGIYATCKIIVGENNITLSDASNSYSNVEETEATTIKYARTFNSTNWQALYVPFSMKYSDWSNDFEVAAINNVHQYDDDDNGIFDRTELEIVKVKSGSLKANTPYLIKPKTTGTKTITINNTTLKKTEVNSIYCASVNTMYTFTGTYSTISGATMISNGYYGMGGGELVQAEDNTASLGAFRWYLKIENKEEGSYAPGKITVLCLDDEMATGIDENVVDVENKVVGIYDANGRKINEMRNGLNIVKYSDGSTKKIMK